MTPHRRPGRQRKRYADPLRDHWTPRITNGLLLNVPFRRTARPLYSAAGDTGLSTETVDADGTRQRWDNGLIEQAVVNTARIEPRGVLVEGMRTNLCLRSENFADASWVPVNGAVDADSHITPTGAANTTCKLRATAANATFIQDLGVIADDEKVFSVYLKRKTGTGGVDITLDGGTGWTAVTVGSDWTRVSKTQTLADPDVGIRIQTSGDEVLAWGAQLERDTPFASSYIPTGATSITRSAESLQIDNTGGKYCPATSGTMLVAFTSGMPAPDSTRYIMDCLKTASGGGVRIYQDGTSGKPVGLFYSGAILLASLTASSALVQGTTVALAIAWQVNDFRLYVNGGDEQADTSGSAPSGVPTEIGVGCISGGGTPEFGNVAHLLTYNRALSAGEILVVSRDVMRWMGM